MKQLLTILSLSLTITICFNCCNNNRISDSSIRIKAENIVNLYDSTNIDFFKTWSFINRGEAGIWFKNSGDTMLYSCIYLESDDLSKLIIGRQENFIKDFEINLPYDTAFWRISILQESNMLKVIGVDNYGRDVAVIENVTKDSIIKNEDPFVKFKELTELRKSLGFIGVQYYERLGGFIQFYLSPYHILTYIPSYDSLNPTYKQVWIEEFDRGVWITKHWNLRKLDKPLDNG